MQSILTNIYVLSLIIAVAGTFVAYLYLRVTKKADEYSKSHHIKNFTLLFVTALSALWCNQKFNMPKNITHLTGGGEGGGISCGTNTSPSLVNESPMNMEKFNIGRPTF